MALGQSMQLRSMNLAIRNVCILAFPLLIVGATASSQEMPLDEQQDKNLFNVENVSSSCHDFTNLFYKSLLNESNNENIAVSPVNLYILLSLLAHGASGPTLDELRSVLHHKDTVSLNEEIKDLLLLLNSIGGVDLITASGIFLQEGFPYSWQFSTTCTDVFNTTIRNLNFHYLHFPANVINAWVAETTDGKIAHAIVSDNFDEDTTMILINAIYFKGKWFKKFDTQFTQERIFHVSESEKILVPTMFMKEKFNISRISQWQASFIEIPYVNPDFVMVILLPDKKVDLRTVENQFNWRTLSNAPRSVENVELYLPKFNFMVFTELKEVLNKVGLNAMFSADNADFTHISERYPLHVGRLLHKVVVEINEEGSDAAAVSVAEVRKIRSAQLPTLFMVDRPFLFAIEHRPSKIPLFLGSVRKIQYKKIKTEL